MMARTAVQLYTLRENNYERAVREPPLPVKDADAAVLQSGWSTHSVGTKRVGRSTST